MTLSLRSELATRIKALFGRPKLEEELEEELEFHLQMEIEELKARGYDETEARRNAAMSFGGRSTVIEECREQRGLHWIEDSARDLLVAARGLRRSPSFSIAALSSLTLGVGATLVIYALLKAVVLDPLPYHDPDRLVSLHEVTPEGQLFSTSDLNILDYAKRAGSLTGIAIESFPPPRLVLTQGDLRLPVQGRRVSGNFFDVLGITPAFGRWWDPEETAPGSNSHQVILSSNLWKTLFGDQSLRNQTIRLGGESWEILGVSPASFHFETHADLWLPYAYDLNRDRGDHRLTAYGRLANGIDLSSANLEMSSIAKALAEEYPEDNAGWGAELQPLRDSQVGSSATRTSLALFTAVGLLLLLACSSVSSLTMARTASRRREFTLRRALGASRFRLVQQLATESLLVGVGGTILGLALAASLVPLIKTLAAEALPRIDQMALTKDTLIVASAMAITTSLLFGIAPAMKASAQRAASSREGESQRLRSLLVAFQLGLALVLSMTSLTLFQSLSRMASIDPGFNVKKLLAVDITLPPERYPEGSDQVLQFYKNLLEVTASLPGVTHAAGSTLHPFVGPALANKVSLPESVNQSETIPVSWRAVTPGLFRTMGIPLLRGRDFQEDEPTLVAILSMSLATQLFGDQDPLGQGVRWIPPNGPIATVVGVVPDTRDLDLEGEQLPTYYWFQGHMRWTNLSLLLRTDGDPTSLITAIRAEIQTADPHLPPVDVRLVTEDLTAAAATQRLAAEVFGSFSFAAIVIALVGLYGVISYAVSSRRAEIALRLAIGARPIAIGHSFVCQGLRLLLLGLGLGLAGTFIVTRLMSQILYETTALEPIVLIAAIVLFLAITLTASLIPALRMARRNPREALM